jgi:hypothetical protein
VRDTLEDIRISGNILYTRRGHRISRFIASMTSSSSTAASLRQQRQAERALSSGSARDRNPLLSGFYELLSWIGSSGTAVACSAWPSVTPSVRYSPLAGYWEEHPLAVEIDEVAGGSFYYREPPAIRGRGYVAASLEAALWAFSRSSTFEEGSPMAVNQGEDTDMPREPSTARLPAHTTASPRYRWTGWPLLQNAAS